MGCVDAKPALSCSQAPSPPINGLTNDGGADARSLSELSIHGFVAPLDSPSCVLPAALMSFQSSCPLSCTSQSVQRALAGRAFLSTCHAEPFAKCVNRPRIHPHCTMPKRWPHYIPERSLTRCPMGWATFNSPSLLHTPL